MLDDPTLLRRYATERTEEAFAELVRRHLPLVYSAAVRRLSGDTHRAEDVAQAVFCAVARDAHRLAQHSALTGWLYTATRNAVIDEIRTAQRRRAREEEAHIMQATLLETETPTDWSQLRPVLDAAMDELSSDDREAVLLRFFQGRPFAEIGTTLGLSEDTARKRVDRALDKLRGLLGRHKIASTSAALAALLASETIAATPAGLAATITGAALAAGGATAATAGAVALLSVSKLQIGLAAAVIASGAVGLVTQQRSLSTLHEQVAITQQQLAQLATENAAFATARTAADADLAKLRTELATVQKPPAATTAKPRTDPSPVAKLPKATDATAFGPLPDTPEIRKQKDYWHRRYDPFFQQHGLTTAQGDRFVELKIHQAIEHEDFQASVRAANLRGDSRAVQALRARDVGPITRELFELLGKDGYEAYGEYEVSSIFRMSFVEPLLPAFASANAPLSPQQAGQLVHVFAASARHVQANRTDIGTTGSMDWDAVVAQAGGILTPPQLTALQTYANQRKSGR